MDGVLRRGETAPEVVVGGDAHQRFHDARGYGRPTGDGRVALAPVEAAHLLFRGDLGVVRDGDDPLDFRDLLGRVDLRILLVYRDLRDRGFYLSPAREGWVDDPTGDLVVYPRGKGPGDGAVAYRLSVFGERTPVPVADRPAAVAVVDEDGEPTYFEVTAEGAGGEQRGVGEGTAAGDDGPTAASGNHGLAPPSNGPSVDDTGLDAGLLDDRVVVWDPSAALYERAFYGQRLAGRAADEGPVQLSLVEAAHLASFGVLDLDPAAVRERGRSVEGDRFDRRLRVYTEMRAAGSAPKSGFKFGADFRVYDDFGTADDPGHSDRLVRVVPSDWTPLPRDLSLDVRLAGGVRKRMVFALTGTDSVVWTAVERLTP